MKAILAAALSLSLAACGGGGSAPPDNTAALAKDAIKAIADKTPTPKPFTGAYTLVNNVGVGHVAGSSPHDVVAYVASLIINSPTKTAQIGNGDALVEYAAMYRLMLSADGLKVAIVGEKVGVSAITGISLYAPNVVYTVKLTSVGLVITY